jgi:fructokinase
MESYQDSSSDEPHLILGIGELLWDLLPDGPRLGGAPANFTVMASRLGDHAAMLSRIGRDALGQAAMDALDPLPVDASHVEIDPTHETGKVTVRFECGEPQYTIHEPSAWDFMELTNAWVQLAERADALCFGSLAQRCRESRQTIQTLVAQAKASCVRIFDVNLRAPFYSGEILQESLELATVVKLNEIELPVVLSLLGMAVDERLDAAGLRHGATRLLDEFPALDMVAVTRGGDGSLLMRREAWNEHPGYAVKVADTVGSGDAFTAALAHHLLRGADLALLNRTANRWGSWVASQAGAMPVLTEETRLALEKEIEA